MYFSASSVCPAWITSRHQSLTSFRLACSSAVIVFACADAGGTLNTSINNTAAAIAVNVFMSGYSSSLYARGLERREDARVPERHAAEANASRIMDGVRNRRDRGLADRLPRPVVRKVRAIRTRIAVHDHDVDRRRRIGVRQRRMRD